MEYCKRLVNIILDDAVNENSGKEKWRWLWWWRWEWRGKFFSLYNIRHKYKRRFIICLSLFSNNKLLLLFHIFAFTKFKENLLFYLWKYYLILIFVWKNIGVFKISNPIDTSSNFFRAGQLVAVVAALGCRQVFFLYNQKCRLTIT